MSISSWLAIDDGNNQKKTLVIGGVIVFLLVSLSALAFAFSNLLGTRALISTATPVSTKGAVPARSTVAEKVSVVNVSYFDLRNKDLKFATNDNGNWAISRVDAPGSVGQDTTLAVDSKGKMHIAYYDDAPNYDLKYATNASGTWVTSTLDATGNVGWYPSLVVDAYDKLHIAYFDNTNRDLKYATNVSGSWVTSVVDAGTSRTDLPGRYISLALDKNGKAHIGYQFLKGGDSTLGSLVYNTNASGAWVKSTVDAERGAGFGVAVKVDALGKVHLSYQGMNRIKYANNIAGKWAIASVDPNLAIGNGTIGFNTSLALDSANKAYVCYVAGRSVVNYQIKCASNVSGRWQDVVTAGDKKVGTFNSLGVDDKNNLYVIYFNAITQTLDLTTNATGSWVTSTIDKDGAVGTWTSLVLSYKYVTPEVPPVPYGPYVLPTPPLPYKPDVSSTPPLPYDQPVKDSTVDLACPPSYVDVNGDNQLTAEDSQLVINYLNGDRTAIARTGAIWQNQVNPVDVDGSSVVVPQDSLTVVNAINQGTGKILEKSCAPPSPYAGN